MNSFNLFIAIACIHRDMSERRNLFFNAIQDAIIEEEAGTLDALKREQVEYVTRCHKLLSAIDELIEMLDDDEIAAMQEQFDLLLSIAEFG